MTYHLARDAGPNDTLVWLSTPDADLKRLRLEVERAEARTLRHALTYGRGNLAFLAVEQAWIDAQAALALAESRVDPTVSSILDDAILKVGSEYMVVRFADRDAVQVGRGGFGTARDDHAAGDAATAVVLRVVATFDVELIVEGSPVSAGDKGDVTMSEAGRVVAVKLIADVVGDLEVDVQRAAFATPTLGAFASIVGVVPPALSGEQTYADDVLTDWLVDYDRGDVLRFVVASSAGLSRATVVLTCSTTV